MVPGANHVQRRTWVFAVRKVGQTKMLNMGYWDLSEVWNALKDWLSDAVYWNLSENGIIGLYWRRKRHRLHLKRMLRFFVPKLQEYFSWSKRINLSKSPRLISGKMWPDFIDCKFPNINTVLLITVGYI